VNFPKRVRIVEVGARDGLQNEPVSPDTVPVPDKVAYIRKLVDAGLPSIEIGAFVRPDLVPQMADTEQVVSELGRELLAGPAQLVALVPNPRGLDRARDAGVKHIAIFTAASEAFNQANIRMSVDQSLDRFVDLVADARASGISVRGYLSTCWWCPFAGKVEADQVRRVVGRLVELGCDDLSVADTIGYATPVEVRSLLEQLIGDVGKEILGVHFHDTRGTALANVLMALDLGISTVDSSAGGLGGCPFAPGAAGNLATEELVFMLQGMGIETGVDLEALRAASLKMELALEAAQSKQGRKLPSRYLRAGPLVPRNATPGQEGGSDTCATPVTAGPRER
jgi:hydroxymethylglutaryl-CoA lyase